MEGLKTAIMYAPIKHHKKCQTHDKQHDVPHHNMLNLPGKNTKVYHMRSPNRRPMRVARMAPAIKVKATREALMTTCAGGHVVLMVAVSWLCGSTMGVWRRTHAQET